MLTLASDLKSYMPIALICLMAIGFGVANVVLSQLFGPRRQGKIKGQTYESGMYLIAMVFLVFDVEVVFLYPWAVTFPNLAVRSDEGLLWLFRILFFLLTTVVAFLYGYRKGVFKFD
jgi:NADH-quinone oxidoreductase subunit A